jgi:formylglycine-generating enzyme required for sulfatase activity
MTRLHLPLGFLLTLPLLFLQVSGGGAPALDMVVPVVTGEVGVEARPAEASGGQGQGAGDLVAHDLAAHELAAPAPANAAPAAAPLVATRKNTALVQIPAGSFRPLFLQQGETEARVAAFELDRHQVTRGEFLDFVRANPQWRRSQVKRIFADEHYLADWPGDLDVGDADDARRPVTQVSWFAAKAYCEAQGGRLPTVDEWEYVAAASETERDATRDPVFLQWLLELYTRPAPRPLPRVGTGFRNAYGIEGLHGPVREWVLDFNTNMVSDDSRGVGARDHQLYCAGGAVGATRTDDYAAFLRYTFRSGLNGRSTVDNLGFRCAGGR